MKQWFKLTDSSVLSIKWQRLGRKIGISPAIVSFVYVAAMSSASSCNDRGSLDDFDPDDIDFFGDFEAGTTQKIMTAFEQSGIVEDGRIQGWDESQRVPTSEEADRARQQAAERQRRCRSKKSDVTPCHDESRNVTPCHAMSRDVTPCHDESRNVTHTDQIRTDQNRSEERREDTLPPTPSGGNREREAPERPPIDFSHSNGLYHGFKYVWNLWPIQQAEEDAWKEYCIQSHRHVLPDSYALADIIDNLKQNDARWQEGYVPLMSSWLKGQRWKDKPVAEPQPRQRARSSPQSRIDEVNAQAARMSALFDRDGEQTPPEQIPGIEN